MLTPAPRKSVRLEKCCSLAEGRALDWFMEGHSLSDAGPLADARSLSGGMEGGSDYYRCKQTHKPALAPGTKAAFLATKRKQEKSLPETNRFWQTVLNLFMTPIRGLEVGSLDVLDIFASRIWNDKVLGDLFSRSNSNLLLNSIEDLFATVEIWDLNPVVAIDFYVVLTRQ